MLHAVFTACTGLLYKGLLAWPPIHRYLPRVLKRFLYNARHRFSFKYFKLLVAQCQLLFDWATTNAPHLGKQRRKAAIAKAVGRTVDDTLLGGKSHLIHLACHLVACWWFSLQKMDVKSEPTKIHHLYIYIYIYNIHIYIYLYIYIYKYRIYKRSLHEIIPVTSHLYWRGGFNHHRSWTTAFAHPPPVAMKLALDSGNPSAVRISLANRSYHLPAGYPVGHSRSLCSSWAESSHSSTLATTCITRNQTELQELNPHVIASENQWTPFSHLQTAMKDRNRS